MELGLINKHVLITGGTRGIGLQLTEDFLNEGSIVSVIARNIPGKNSKFENLKKIFSNKLFFYKSDVTDLVDFQKTYNVIIKNTNNIDIVISNVGDGSSQYDPIENIKHWEKSWAINFNSALYTTNLFLDLLVKSKGVLIFISSIAGTEYISAPIGYSTAKNALNSFAKSLSHKNPSIRVNVVAPGNILTNDGSWAKKLENDPKKITEYIEANVPLKRFGTPKDVCNLILFLSSFNAEFITGSCIVIDGGQTKSF
jgi:3-oxoacyl-[acyl-carrier protein] reductase